MANKTDLTIEQGTTFAHIFYITDDANNPSNLTGVTSSTQMKRWYSSVNHISIASTVNATAGTVTLNMTAAQSANIAYGRYVYETTVADAANNITRISEGIVTVSPGVVNASIDTTSNTYSNTNFTVIPLIG